MVKVETVWGRGFESIDSDDDVITNYPPDAELYPAQADPASMVLYIVLLARDRSGLSEGNKKNDGYFTYA